MQGAIFSDYDVRDYQLICATANKSQDFPQTFELEMRGIKHQGEIGSCVAHSLASIIEYYNHIQTGRDIKMSVGYIYGNRENSTHKAPGMVIRDALEVVKNYGDVPYSAFPYNIEAPEAIELFNARGKQLLNQGYPNRISEYYRVNSADAIKTALLNGKPVLSAMYWYTDMEVKDGILTTNFEGFDGGHCMFIYGWDERGWKIQNSWGRHWGIRGTVIVPYNIPIAELWVVSDDIIENMIVKKPLANKKLKPLAKLINKIVNIFKLKIKRRL